VERDDHIWICELTRAGKKQWIVWNPQGARKFDVPVPWHVKSSTSLLHEQSSLNGSTIEIGPIPTLLIGRS
jgi:hypothetical protein